jgi:hypothetical protein
MTRFDFRCLLPRGIWSGFGRIPTSPLRLDRSATDANKIMPAKLMTPMITPILLREPSLDEPGARIPHAGLCEGAVGKPAVPS